MGTHIKLDAALSGGGRVDMGPDRRLSAVSTKGNWRSFKRADFREQGLICRIRQLWSALSCDGEVVGMLNYATPLQLAEARNKSG